MKPSCLPGRGSDPPMPRFAFLIVTLGPLLGAGCDGKGSAQGGGSENGGRGRVGMNLPF